MDTLPKTNKSLTVTVHREKANEITEEGKLMVEQMTNIRRVMMVLMIEGSGSVYSTSKIDKIVSDF